MKTFIRDSIKIINANLVFIPFLAISGIVIISPSIMRFFSIVFVILAFVFYPIVYGRLIEIVLNLSITSPYNLLKVHWFNYLCVIILMVISVFALSFFYFEMQYFNKIIIKNLIGAFIVCLTIYVLPLVFIRRQVLSSVITGITTLFEKFSLSIPLIMLTFVIFIVKAIVEILIVYISPIKVSTVFGIAFLQNIINVYIALIVFTAATMVLKDQDKQSPVNPGLR